MKRGKKIDSGSLAVMSFTLVLFVGAVYTKGFTHDLLLEAGVFLVSVKLIIMAYKNNVSTGVIQNELREIKQILLKENPVLENNQEKLEKEKE